MSEAPASNEECQADYGALSRPNPSASGRLRGRVPVRRRIVRQGECGKDPVSPPNHRLVVWVRGYRSNIINLSSDEGCRIRTFSAVRVSIFFP